VPNLALKEEEFLDALRLRLLIPIFNRDPAWIRACPCDQYVQGEDEYAYHALTCGRVLSNVWRHDSIKEALKNFLQACGKRDIALEVPAGNHPQLRLDISYQEGSIVKYIDVSVVNPTARQYDRTVGEEMAPGHPATTQENEKTRKYTVHQTGISADNFIPFVLEATGRLGPAAVKFIDSVSGIKHAPDPQVKKQRNFFLQRLSAILIKDNSRHLRNYRNNSKRLLRNGENMAQDNVVLPPDPIVAPVVIHIAEPDDAAPVPVIVAVAPQGSEPVAAAAEAPPENILVSSGVAIPLENPAQEV